MTKTGANVFCVPYKDGFLLYAPLKGIVVAVDDRVHRIFESLERGYDCPDDEFTRSWLETFELLGVLEEDGSPSLEDDEPFRPTSVTLSLSTRCNLACVYCYARAGEAHRDMGPEIAESALELVVSNAVERGSREVGLAFHGEGEPTINWPLLTHCVQYAEDLAARHGLVVNVTMSTNGMWNASQRDYIVRHFRNISISMDGTEAIQNAQRPISSGRDSFRRVMDNIKAIDKTPLPWGLRATILPGSVGDMSAMIDLVARETSRCGTVCFEPCAPNGRGEALADCVTREQFYGEFLESYREARDYGASRGIQVSYSGCKPTAATGTFCRAYGPEPNFVVMSDGTVSSCYEIKDPGTEKGRIVVYGAYDAPSKTFRFDQARLGRLRELSVADFGSCDECFVRWSCGGDCLARVDVGPQERRSTRCTLNQLTTLDDLALRAAINFSARKTAADT